MRTQTVLSRLNEIQEKNCSKGSTIILENYSWTFIKKLEFRTRKYYSFPKNPNKLKRIPRPQRKKFGSNSSKLGRKLYKMISDLESMKRLSYLPKYIKMMNDSFNLSKRYVKNSSNSLDQHKKESWNCNIV